MYKDIQTMMAIAFFFIFIQWIQQMASSVSGWDNCHRKWSLLSSIVEPGGADLAGIYLIGRYVLQQWTWRQIAAGVTWWLRDTIQPVPIRGLVNKMRDVVPRREAYGPRCTGACPGSRSTSRSIVGSDLLLLLTAVLDGGGCRIWLLLLQWL